MKQISINWAKPDIVKTNIYSYAVSGWNVRGKIVDTEQDCRCTDKSFDVYIEWESLSITEEKLEELVIEKLKL